MAITKAETLLQQYKTRERTLRGALREASSPERMFLGAAGGIASSVGLAQLLDRQVTGKALAIKPGEQPGFFKSNPNFTKGLVNVVAGAGINVVNLALDYSYPMALERELVHQGSTCLMAIGINKMADNWPVSTPTQQPAPTR